MRALVMSIVLCLTACVSVEEDETSVDVAAINPPLGDRENQGRNLLGAGSTDEATDGLDDLAGPDGDFFAVKRDATRGATTVDVGVQGIRLVPADGLPATGLVFHAVAGAGELEIAGELPATAAEPYRYLLLYRDAPGATPRDPCHGDTALPFVGRFTADGRHVAVDGELSLGCASGTAVKCVKFGYIPSETDTPGDDLWDAHEACTHMASATYCMDRQSFTREGTFIELMDDFGVRSPTPPNMTPPRAWTAWLAPASTWPPPRRTFYLEAGWDDEDAPFCLSKARFTSLPPDPCPGVLADPRIDPTARYCEDYSHDELALAPVLIWNTSMVNDLPFDTWEQNGRLVTTVRGFHDARATHPPSSGMTWVGSSGILLREPTAEMTAPGILEEVRLYCVPNGGDCVVTTAATAPSTYTDDRGFEGYVFTSAAVAPPDSIPLHLYRRLLPKDWVTATSSPGGGYTDQGEVGYVLR